MLRGGNVYQRRLSVNITDVSKYRKLCNWFKRYYSRYGFEDFYPGPSRRILEEISDLSFIPAFLLCHCCCRFSELEQISFLHIKYFKDFEINSTKSKNIKVVPHLHRYDTRYIDSLDNSTRLMIMSYDQFKFDLKSAQTAAGIPKIKGILDVTHIFRHIFASVSSDKGVDVSHISNRLGHETDKTTAKYIHRGVFI